jgi:transcriptional regulator with XRE-family HTH domain
VDNVCEIGTVTQLSTWAEVGGRVRQARLAAGLTQAELAARLGLDRTAVAKIEGGVRHLDALELFGLADTLHLAPAYFLAEPRLPVVSRRQALLEEPDAAARQQLLLEADLETHSRNTELLIGLGLLRPPVELTRFGGHPDLGR